MLTEIMLLYVNSAPQYALAISSSNFAIDGVENEMEFNRICEEVEKHAASIGEEALVYWRDHKPRFEWTANYLIGLSNRFKRKSSSYRRILDIGNSSQTLLFSKAISNAQVDTLGYFDVRYPIDESSHHYEYDLNDSIDEEAWILPENGTYDIISFLEVIEHLYTSPIPVLGMLREFLSDDGFLVIQTPNAAALWKRVLLLKGRNPYELIRLSRTAPGHFREYTVKELKDYAAQTGFEVVETRVDNFYKHTNPFPIKWQSYTRWLPDTCKDSITITLRKTGA